MYVMVLFFKEFVHTFLTTTVPLNAMGRQESLVGWEIFA